MNKAPFPNALCRCAVSMLRADSCAVQLRKPSSVSLTNWRRRLHLFATSHHVDVQLTEKGISGSFFLFQGGEIRLSPKRRGALWKATKTLSHTG